MNAALNYFIEANVAILLILAFYVLFLRKETDFRLQRFFLLGGLLCSLLFPLMHIEQNGGSQALSIGQVLPYHWLPEVVIGGSTEVKPAAAPFHFWTWTGALYLAGFIIVSIFLVMRLADLFSVMRRSRTYRLQKLRIAESAEDRPTFSFFNFIFIGNAQTLNESEKNQIIGHESVHAREGHSFDILFINVLQAVFWYNPAIAIYRKIFIQLHEFQADARAVPGSEVDKYCSFLAKVALKSAGFTLVNHFNNSLTVKRIEMMRTIKRNVKRWKIAAASLALPILFAVVACQDQIEQDVRDIAQNSTMALVVPPEVQQQFDQLQKENPESKYVILELNETASAKLEALKKKYGGVPQNIQIFPHNEETTLPELSGLGDFVYERNPSTEASGLKHSYAILEFNSQTDQVADAFREGDIYTVVEENPVFPGGYTAMMDFMRSNIRYPEASRQKGEQGTVFVSFVVEKDGDITNVGTIRGVSPALDAEAMRVVEAFPNWTPAKNKGEAVRVKFVLPVKFSTIREVPSSN